MRSRWHCRGGRGRGARRRTDPHPEADARPLSPGPSECALVARDRHTARRGRRPSSLRCSSSLPRPGWSGRPAASVAVPRSGARCRSRLDGARACRRRPRAPRLVAVGRPDARRPRHGLQPAGGSASLSRHPPPHRRAGAARARHRVVRQRRELSRRARLDHRRASRADDARRGGACGLSAPFPPMSDFWRSRCSAPCSASPSSTSTPRKCFSATPAACRSGSCSPSC